jgi:glycosyltransferase involved in cell wall biosynthesis
LRRKQDRSNALEQIIFILSASFWTLRLLVHFKPDATLAFFGIPSGAVALVLKQFYRIPYVISLRGGDVPGFRPYDFHIYHKIAAPFLKAIWKNASAIVANSSGLRDLAQAFDGRFTIPIIPNGVNIERYRVEQRDWYEACILTVGRLVHQKGLDIAMHALAGLKDLDWHWTIVGDGPEMNALKFLARQLGISERVTFAGWLSRDEVIQSYKKSTLLLFPSRHEGMPNAVLEAMASGLPVVASRIAGNEELVADGETGFLVKSENIESLRGALRELIQQPSLRQKMGDASRRRVETSYSWESTAQKYVLLLEKVK